MLHGAVVDLLWEDVSGFFDPDVVGSLPDVRVPDSSVVDWQALLDLVPAVVVALDSGLEDGVTLRPSRRSDPVDPACQEQQDRRLLRVA
ncbi:hypothetical protein AB0D49_28680 [Streptomyces sp. NPDC048290]|uniref:hypothetical protein n=1 Tax=Streptomyces sp. NPDC048290 TaxID=3155811 RepID=UPI00343A424C